MVPREIYIPLVCSESPASMSCRWQEDSEDSKINNNDRWSTKQGPADASPRQPTRKVDTTPVLPRRCAADEPQQQKTPIKASLQGLIQQQSRRARAQHGRWYHQLARRAL